MIPNFIQTQTDSIRKGSTLEPDTLTAHSDKHDAPML
jgi:hypothetical protein